MEVFKLKPYGYCFGVIEALELIKDVRKKHSNKNVYVFGMLVHNLDVVKYLNSIGVISVDTSNIDKEKRLNEFTSKDIVVFTAHGHNKKYEEILKNNNVIYYDATCKNVTKNMDVIEEYVQNNQVIYIGKKNHPETEAALSISPNVIIYDINEGMNENVLISKNPLITNQTTLSILEINNIHQKLKSKYPEAIFIDEICSQTRIRQTNIINFNQDVDLVVVIGSIHSSNTDKLYQLSLNKFKNSKIIKVENIEDIKDYDLSQYKKCMITSGTSTPLKSIDEIEEYLRGI